MKTKYKRYLAYFFATAAFFFWFGLLCGAGMGHHSAEKQSEKYRVEMVKDSLYYEFINSHDTK